MFRQFGNRRIRAHFRVAQISGVALMRASLLLALALLAFVTYVLLEMRETDRGIALQSARNVLATISADISRNIELYDLSLQAVIDNLRNPELDRVSDSARKLILFDRSATAKHLDRIQVLDKTGRVTLVNRGANDAGRDLSGLDFFLWHRSQNDLGVHVGGVIASPDGSYVMSVSRRISGDDGSFAGVVVGTLRLSYVQELFSRVKLENGSALTLTTTQGQMLARLPYIPRAIGADFSHSIIFKSGSASAPGDFEALAGIDGLDRMYSFRRVDDLPLILVIGIAKQQAYAHWRAEAFKIGGIAVTFCLTMLGLAAFSSRELRRRIAVERRLKRLAATDATTGLNNRRSFNIAIDREWKRARRLQTPTALLMIDADHFKSHNDHYGHLAGDLSLIAIANCVAEATRAGDTSARYGGEEFALLLPNTTLREAETIAERLRAAVAAIGASGIIPCPTISIGAASITPSHAGKPSALVIEADSALYNAKRKGRNRVELASPEECAEAA